MCTQVDNLGLKYYKGDNSREIISRAGQVNLHDLTHSLSYMCKLLVYN